MSKSHKKNLFFVLGGIFLSFVLLCLFGYSGLFGIQYSASDFEIDTVVGDEVSTFVPPAPVIPPLDKEAYNKKLIKLANNDVAVVSTSTEQIASSTNIVASSTTSVPPKSNLWPIETVYPNAGALLPFNRIIAYYGNFYSTKMGVLGEYPHDELLAKLNKEIDAWNLADPETPVIPAIHYIAVTAQASPGESGKYRLRMPDSEIDKAITLADEIGGIVFLDIQVGLSDLESELPALEKYFKMPQVHLGIDPEFSMKTGARPGKVIGTMDATDINYAASYLANLVRENNLPPKILVVHRFTNDMVTNYKQIMPLPEVQIVAHMDGWGFPAKKFNTYKRVIYSEPIQFTGFKIFYKNDLQEPTKRLATPQELLELKPIPIYIQYQ